MKAGQLWIVQTAGGLSDLVRESVLSWDRDSLRTIGWQLIRSADSVGANMVEGYGREHALDSLRFYSIARGSLEETIYWLHRSGKGRLIPENICKQLIARYQFLERALNKFIQVHRPSV